MPELMAYDLAGTPTTGIEVQACGDCHLLNLGLFATPERNLIFDLRDFDETLRAPWEWDVKRLVASFVVAGRSNGLSDQCVKDVATKAGRRDIRGPGDDKENPAKVKQLANRASLLTAARCGALRPLR